ncbi:MAG TPA: hypothetical protein VK922_18335 [Gemmatimonadaceae bacterium]|nr:hypothetical protein [Gemmatimonadaceae bacterium]
MRARTLLLVALFASFAASGAAQPAGIPPIHRDPGIPVSMFGISIAAGELLIYPFFEYYRDADAEYAPIEFGTGPDLDYRGRYRASEGLLFLGYGLSDRLAVEFEAAVISARLEKSPDDTSAMPAVIEESGLGDVEGQLRWLWNRRAPGKSQLFSYFETVFPLQKDRRLIGTQYWEFKFGTGIVRDFPWGAMTLRAAVEYDGEEKKAVPGEYAVEFLRRLNRTLRLYAGIEGSEDEVEGIAELQIALAPSIALKLNSAFGLTSKATDWAPEIGVLFRFR